MGDNTGFAGNRIRIIDPNKEFYQNNSVFGENGYNMSVPIEDLSIMVEFITEKKNRTVITVDSNKGSNIQNTNVNQVRVNFIDSTQTDKNVEKSMFLTTSYTNISTQLEPVSETLGITNIEIEFNSSYAPMVNINFIDVKGSSIFQNGGKSKYDVFFRLPYPLFELTIKGYYGKAVKYCLHMIKCNTKFNSETGNFEIAAQFVGYTYALLSDMLIGYIGAAGVTANGQKELKSRNVISISEFTDTISKINSVVQGEVLTIDNQNVIDYKNISDAKIKLIQMSDLITAYIDTISADVSLIYTSGIKTVVLVKDDVDNDGNLITISPVFRNNLLQFQTQFSSLITEYNELVKNNNNTLSYPAIASTQSTLLIPIDLSLGICDIKNNKANQAYASTYTTNPTSKSSIDEISTRLNIAIKDVFVGDCVNNNDSNVRIFDFTEAVNRINELISLLDDVGKNATERLGLDLKNKVSAKLGFDPTIRNIFNLFTTHVEVFLKLLFEVSAKYKDIDRINELKKIAATNTKNTGVDIVIGGDVIYPWPEYYENGKETYLGTSKKINPDKIPEIKFVDELYNAMIDFNKQQQQAELNFNNGVDNWNAVNPIDSAFKLYENVTPYDRLKGAPNFNDIARLISLRAAAFLGFSNAYLSDIEITTFAQSEVDLILKKYKNGDNKIISLLKTNYNTVEKLATVTGTIGAIGVTSNKPVFKLLTKGSVDDQGQISITNNTYKYQYIFDDAFGRWIVPITPPYENTQGFKYDTISSEQKQDAPKHYISNRFEGQILGISNDKAGYIDFILDSDYKIGANQSGELAYSGLKEQLSSPDHFVQCGFNANSGSYGVQEFTTINYGGSEYGVSSLEFYTLFYDDASNTADKDSWVPILTSPTKNNKGLSSIFNIRNFSSNTNRTFINSLKAKYNICEYEPKQIYDDRTDLGKNLLLISRGNTSISCPYFSFKVNNKMVSLFGSRFYNGQSDDGKALLFLHTFPWRGLIRGNNKGIFTMNEILNIFQYRTGFVQIPYLLPAFIGGLLKRYMSGSNSDMLKFIGFNGESLLLDCNNFPSTSQYLRTERTPGSMAFEHDSTLIDREFKYIDLEQTLIGLPDQIINRFINEFDKFVSKDFQTIKSIFELVPLSSGATIDEKWVNSWKAIDKSTTLTNNTEIYDVSVIAIDNNLQGKESISTIYNKFLFTATEKDSTKNDFKYNYFLEYKDNSEQNVKLRNLIFSKAYISNQSSIIWNSKYSGHAYKNIYISEINLTKYFGKIIEGIDKSVAEQQKFNNNDTNPIKLEIYRTLKKIYDKWVAYSDNAKSVMFQCCTTNKDTTPTRLDKDKKLHFHRTQNDNEPDLIDSFRFVTRSFKDIGDEFQINPLMVSKQLFESTNISFYDFIGRILTDNNFDFVALPSFIDYNDPEELKSVFKAYPYYEAKKLTTSGPSFVCVYVGQTSTKLDFKGDVDYPNDGFDLNENCIDCPDDFNDPLKDYEDYGAAFVVRYGHQNQNIFKDVMLDQSEFTETAESLQITDNIANSSLSQTNQLYFGQNLYNVYSTRSYRVDIEMLGNAMIQPMMYFQLENIPMFHGAYLITKVKHSLKPNHMSTVFSGVRIKRIETPLLSVAALYSGLINGYAIENLTVKSGGISNQAFTSPSGSTRTGRFAPIVKTIIDNGGSNGNPEAGTGNIKLTKIDLPIGIKNSITDGSDILINEAIQPFKQMLSDWVSWMKTNNFIGSKEGNNTYYAYINSCFRTYEKQVEVKKEAERRGHGNSAAEPGKSYHGWGIAVDLQYFRKNGNVILNYNDNVPNLDEGFNYNINESMVWLIENSYKYGFVIPKYMRDNNGIEEFWHWEYQGTAAPCMVRENNSFYNTDKNGKDIIVTVNAATISSVTNPKEPDGSTPKYFDCDYTEVKFIDGTLPVPIPANKNIIVNKPNNPIDDTIYTAILNGLGAPNTPENIKFFYAWREAESGVAAWNPFNTTHNYPNATNYTCVKVKNYSSKDDGISATIKTLKLNYYTKIRNGLINNVGAETISSYLDELNIWGTGHGINKVLSGAKILPPEIAKLTTKTVTC